MDQVHDYVSRLKALSKELGRSPTKVEFIQDGATDYTMRNLGGFNALMKMANLEIYSGAYRTNPRKINPNILVLDLELAPIEAYVWGIWDVNIGINQIKKDWHLLSWVAKWMKEKNVHYADQSKKKKIQDDKEILLKLRDLINKADIVITYNGIKFDRKKFNARLAIHKINPPSSFIHIDVLRIVKKHFAFTSNKLEFVCEKLNKKYKKLSHPNFPGMELWKACLEGNKAAWKEMRKYNIHDVLALEELYLIIQRWERGYNPNVFFDNDENECSCGSENIEENGFKYTSTGKFQRYVCVDCGAEFHARQNLLPTGKKSRMVR